MRTVPHPRCPVRRIAILASTFHRPLARALVRGATRVLHDAGVAPKAITVYWLPGAFELPVAAARVLRRRQTPDAVIALGALIQGDTPQYEVLAHAVAQGLTQLAVTSAIPVTFGVIIAKSLAQARARAGGSMGNRGAEAAHAALAVLQVP